MALHRTCQPRGTYLLGLCCNIHESSAALVKDGVADRGGRGGTIHRKKHDNRFPAESPSTIVFAKPASRWGRVVCRLLLAAVEGLLKRLWWLVRYFPASLQTFHGGKHWRGSVGTLVSHLAVPFKLRRMGFRGKFYFVDHHLAHAASTFLVSPHESAAVLTVDLCGEDCTTLFARGSGNRIRPSGASIFRIRWASSTRH